MQDIGLPTLTLKATGNVPVSVFVALDASAPRGVAVAGANVRTIGISEVGQRSAPNLIEALGGTATAYAAIANDELGVYTQGHVALVTAGTGGFTNGDLLESAAGGLAVTSTVTGHFVGAVALDTVPAGAQGLVLIIRDVK